MAFNPCVPHHAVAPKWLHATGNMRERSAKHMSSVSIQLSEAPSLLQHIRRNRKSCHCCKQKAGLTPIHQVMGWLRCHLSFLLLRSAVLCLRGSRSNPNHVSDPPLDLLVYEGWIPWCINCLTSYNIQSFKYLTPHYCHSNYGLFYDIYIYYVLMMMLLV